MALSHGLAQAGRPGRLDVDATVTFVPGPASRRSRSRVDATSRHRRGRVPDAAEDAKENCPVSKALLAQ
jgi:organic hydroperoxide reductase OsmC/OhrA